MKTPVRWQVLFGAGLVVLSALIYGLHYLLFRDAHHIGLYLVGDLAFLPVDVLVVTLILHQILTRREKKAMLNKMNMVIGVFFSETGNELLRRLTEFGGQTEGRRAALCIQGNWTPRQFLDAAQKAAAIDPEIDCRNGDLVEMRAFLLSRRDCLLRLLENPNLLEHEAFTDVLWSVVHLTEELAARDFSNALPDTDLKHLAGDMRRAYDQTTVAWVRYMQHLQSSYPYLFSLALRQNPFDANASVAVK